MSSVPAPLFSLVDLDRQQPEQLPGSRLRRLEIYNWGTFDRHVWNLEADGRNALLTGDIGSGKSTLVDAVTTLLLPAHKISYNRAAGADTRERDLRSYVEGHYKAERNEITGASRPVGLRDGRQFSVILGIFANPDFNTSVTLAQVFRTKDTGQPDRFYVVAPGELSITSDFSDFGTDLPALKRRLRESGAHVYDTFPDYGRDFRRRLGIESEQAMELFHQTVSMKAVDNLNDFVRNHMLEPFDAKSQIDDLVEHFDNLTRAHEAVVRARDQLERLAPLVELLDGYDESSERVDVIGRLQRALPYHFARIARALYSSLIEELGIALGALTQRLDAGGSELAHLRASADQLRTDIAGSGGDRLAAIGQEIERLERELPRRRERLARCNELLGAAGLEPATTAERFLAAKESARGRREHLQTDLAAAQNEVTESQVTKRALDDEAEGVNAELHSLRSQPTNIPIASLRLRARLCEDLGLNAEELPFAGELLQVRPDAAEWQGAAERVLHGFALSLLVPTAHYQAVASWVDRRHLGARLVYYRVPVNVTVSTPPDRAVGRPLLLDMLEVKPGSGFDNWLGSELARRANHACVEDASELRDAAKAVTRAGQVKDRDRHEKDDRRRVDDRRNYVLGWSNEQKVEAMIAHAAELALRQAGLGATLAAALAAQGAVVEQIRSLDRLDEYTAWEDLDWEGTVSRIGHLGDERKRILATSDRLAALEAELQQTLGSIEKAATMVKALERDQYGVERDIGTARDALERAERTLADPVVSEFDDTVWSELEVARSAVTGDDAADPTSEALPDLERGTRAALDRQRTEAEEQRSRTGQRAVSVMSDFRSEYPQETLEFDASMAAAGEFRQLHQRLGEDDLPRFETEFKDYLNQNTIRDVAGFAAQLNKHEQLIRHRIDTINRSLVDIDYNPGRYIRLAAEATPNTEVRQFRSDLRDCTDDVIGSEQDDQYSERKFLQVKQIVDRFRGREGSTDADRTWTRRVTDVRQWYIFSASERWRADDTEHEHYADSAGKSGGQKEKLAYTILAASLAYQFKLEWGAARSKAFCFVVIDEAFGRGSEASTQYALELFMRLGLQLLIVTPLQKIQVIEPFVSTVGFVDNPTGSYSRLQTLTIAEYRRRRAERHRVSGGEPGTVATAEEGALAGG
jgi:uncharacterized protein YPO0396